MTLSPTRAEQPALRAWLRAFDLDTLEDFTAVAFPPEWGGIRARILESGATLAHSDGRWAPRWTPIGRTIRVGRTDDETRMRSIFYRVHDCLHQLWGLPHPGDLTSVDGFRYYKRAQMCGEIAVLTLTEFVFARWVHRQFPELRMWIDGRCAVPMANTVLAGRSPTQIALRLDELLHKRWVARWAREDEASLAWLTYYTPMLANDRAIVDACWAAMVAEPTVVDALLKVAPRARFSGRMNGQELTCWMLADFEHLLWSSDEPDAGLVQFNRARRAEIQLPSGWPTGG